MEKVTRQYPQPQPFRRERRAEAGSNRIPSAYQPNALPLGQTGSPWSKEEANYNESALSRDRISLAWLCGFADLAVSTWMRVLTSLHPHPPPPVDFRWQGRDVLVVRTLDVVGRRSD